MKQIAAELLVERLIEWGVDTVFGLPGDGINGITEGLRRHEDRIRFVMVHHEEAAAFMATGYAKATGRSGCAWPPRAGEAFIFSTASTTPRSTMCPCWPSPACRARSCWAPATSRRSTSTGCSST